MAEYGSRFSILSEHTRHWFQLVVRSPIEKLSLQSFLIVSEFVINALPEPPPDSKLILETDRLELRPIFAADAERLFPILSDSSLYTYTGESPPASCAALRKLYTFREGRSSPDGDELWFNWVISERTGVNTVGYVQATVSIDHADTAWVVGSHWQGQGFATEAARAVVDWLRSIGVRRIHANIHPGHTASHRVAEKAGFHSTNQTCDGEQVWISGKS
jgi:RimJ/RimL family protein N-acetyltransferase